MKIRRPALNRYNALKKFCLLQGIALFGVADVGAIRGTTALSDQTLKTCTRAVCLGFPLSRAVLAEIVTEPTRLYFHHYRSVNMFLDQAALAVTGFIQTQGYLALPIPASQIVDWVKQTAHLSHKHLAVAAGLGWIGRNNLLVNARYGSQIRLATVLTDMPLPSDEPVKEDCGKCTACVVACPAKAIHERSEDFDHQACFEKLKDFQKKRIVDQYICGVCVHACSGTSAPGSKGKRS